MIKVNLLGEQQDFATSHLLQLVGYGAALAATIVLCIGVQMSMSSRLADAQDRKGELVLELTKLKKVTKEVEGLEQKKKLLKEKLTTIALLKAKKHGPVRILDDLNIAIPDRAWLSSVREKSGTLEIAGVALDNVTVAQFMATLGQSKSFGNVNLVHTTQLDKDGVKMKEFLVVAELKDPLADMKKPEAATQAASVVKTGMKKTGDA